MTDRRKGLLDETSEAWVSVERAIWPDGPAHGHGSGEYAALKARIIAALAANPAPADLDVEWLARAMHTECAHRTSDAHWNDHWDKATDLAAEYARLGSEQ